MCQNVDVLVYFWLIYICPQEARDSRYFGPVRIGDIVGRVIYYMQTAVDHGPVQNR